jgi:hypothetical protein
MRFRRLYGKVKNGKLLMSEQNAKRWAAILQQIEAGSGEFELEIKQREHRPNTNQYGYLYGGIYRETLLTNKFKGWTEDELEKFFGELFLGDRITIEVSGEPVKVKRIVKSTSSLTHKELSEFIERVIAWLANEGIAVSGPEDYYTK